MTRCGFGARWLLLLLLCNCYFATATLLLLLLLLRRSTSALPIYRLRLVLQPNSPQSGSCFLPPPFYPPSIPGFSRHLESARSLGKSNTAVRGPFPSQAPQGKSVAMKTMLKSRSCANPFFPSPIPMTRPSPEPLPFLSPLSPPQRLSRIHNGDFSFWWRRNPTQTCPPRRW